MQFTYTDHEGRTVILIDFKMSRRLNKHSTHAINTRIAHEHVGTVQRDGRRPDKEY
jgi:hypothetical protein